MQDARLTWNCLRPPGSRGGGLGGAEWDEESKTYQFRAPAGEVRLSLFASTLSGAIRYDELQADRTFIGNDSKIICFSTAQAITDLSSADIEAAAVLITTESGDIALSKTDFCETSSPPEGG